MLPTSTLLRKEGKHYNSGNLREAKGDSQQDLGTIWLKENAHNKHMVIKLKFYTSWQLCTNATLALNCLLDGLDH